MVSRTSPWASSASRTDSFLILRNTTSTGPGGEPPGPFSCPGRAGPPRRPAARNRDRPARVSDPGAATARHDGRFRRQAKADLVCWLFRAWRRSWRATRGIDYEGGKTMRKFLTTLAASATLALVSAAGAFEVAIVAAAAASPTALNYIEVQRLLRESGY